MSRGSKRRRRLVARKLRECDACGDRVRLVIPRAGALACRSCFRLPLQKWEAARLELERIREVERAARG